MSLRGCGKSWGLRHSSWLLAPFFSAESGATEIVALFVWQVWCVQVQVSVPGHLINEFYSFPMTKHWQELSPELWAMQGCKDARIRGCDDDIFGSCHNLSGHSKLMWRLWSVQQQQMCIKSHQLRPLKMRQQQQQMQLRYPNHLNIARIHNSRGVCEFSLVWFATKKALINLCMEELYCT